MARFEFRLPDIGEGLAEAEVAKWLVSVGDRVNEDQPVVEMMTDKASVELPSPGVGVVVEQRAAEGDVVKTGAVLYVLETETQIGAAAADTGAAPSNERPVAPAGAPAAAFYSDWRHSRRIQLFADGRHVHARAAGQSDSSHVDQL